MIKFYDVGNKSNKGMWVLAKDEDDAREVALRFNHVKNIENARPHELTADSGLEFFINGEYTGWVCKVISTLTFQEVIAGKKAKSQWVLQRYSDKMFMDTYGNEAEYGYQLPLFGKR